MMFDRTKIIEALRRMVQQMHYPLEVMLVCVRWYAAIPAELSQHRGDDGRQGVFDDYATLNRWSIKMLPVLAAAFRRRNRPWTRPA